MIHQCHKIPEFVLFIQCHRIPNIGGSDTMETYKDKFTSYLLNENKSENTIRTYLFNIEGYFSWFEDTYGYRCSRLYRENILDYKSYLMNVKRFKSKNLDGKTVNAKLSALYSFNKFLNVQDDKQVLVISKSDFIKIHIQYANPCEVSKVEVEQFRQKILEAGDKRLFALATIIAYAGLRISEALNVKVFDFNLDAKELIIRKGKGGKQRLIYLNSKIANSIKEYLKVRTDKGDYLFSSRESEKVDRSVVNKHFKKFSNKITPHMLRHFYCSNALENNYSIAEVAYQAGHQDIKTTLLYTNPSREKMKSKAELL